MGSSYAKRYYRDGIYIYIRGRFGAVGHRVCVYHAWLKPVERFACCPIDVESGIFEGQ